MPKIEINRVKLHYEKHGQGDEVLILLHGFLASSKMWQNHYLPELTKKFTVYTLDMRGHGHSSTVRNGCNLKQMASDLFQFVTQLNIDKCTLMGMSMGGAIALQFAINWPDKLKTLILISPGPGSVISKGFVFISPLLSLIAQKKFLIKPLLNSALTSTLPQSIMTQYLNDAVLVGKETWLQYLIPDNTIENYSQLKNIKIPSLVIIGGKDKAVSIAFQQEVADTLPNANKKLLEDEGHAVAIENPIMVLTLINSFIADHEKRI